MKRVQRRLLFPVAMANAMAVIQSDPVWTTEHRDSRDRHEDRWENRREDRRPEGIFGAFRPRRLLVKEAQIVVHDDMSQIFSVTSSIPDLLSGEHVRELLFLRPMQMRLHLVTVIVRSWKGYSSSPSPDKALVRARRVLPHTSYSAPDGGARNC